MGGVAQVEEEEASAANWRMKTQVRTAPEANTGRPVLTNLIAWASEQYAQHFQPCPFQQMSDPSGTALPKLHQGK